MKTYSPEYIKDIGGLYPPKEFNQEFINTRLLLRDAYEYVLHRLVVSPEQIPDDIYLIGLAYFGFSYDHSHINEFGIMCGEFTRRFGLPCTKENRAKYTHDIKPDKKIFNKFVRFWVH